SQRTSARRHRHVREPLDCVCKGERMTDRGIAGDRFGEEQSVTPRESLEALFDALVHVEQSKLQVQHGLAGHTKAKVSGLDDAGMHGSHRYLEDALASHGTKRVKITRYARYDTVVVEVLAKRPRALRPIVMKCHTRRVGVPLGCQAKEIHDFAFEPVRRRM